MNNLLPIQNAIAAIRVSSIKQGLQGDSPEAQREQIEQFAKNHNIILKKVFVFIESASKEDQPMQEAIDYCKDPKNDIQLFIIKSIDRFTRGGSYFYDHLKMQLTQYGVRLVDIYGIISNQEVNTLEHLGIKFRWSVYSPTKKAEILEAERAKDEVRDILTRMIGSEIRYSRLGYRVSKAPFGYMNVKAETEHGKRVILVPEPEESQWIIKMFDLRTRGTLSDIDIVQEINKLGYKSRKRYLRNPTNRTQAIGTKGGNKLTLKQFWKYIQNPTYAGINFHKWTNEQPVKGQFEGLVTIEKFNLANRGKVYINEVNGKIVIEKDKIPDWQLKKCVKNPLYPYKRYVLCPTCKSPFYGSASTGKSGKKFPAYHCSKGNHSYRVPTDKFETTIKEFVKGIHITRKYMETLKTSAISEWKRRMEETQKDSDIIETKIKELTIAQLAIAEKIKVVSSPVMIKLLEEDVNKLEKQIIELKEEKESKETEVINMEIVMDKVQEFLEHLEDLLLGGSDPLKKAAYFGVIFNEPPLYTELLSETPTLEPFISLNEIFERTQSLNVDDQGLEPRTYCV